MNHICQVCDKNFPRSGQLETHVQTHSGKKSFDCRLCQKSFSCSSNLKSHNLTHTGEQLFLCTVCNKSFSQFSNLKTHLKTHIDKTPYSCSKCTKSYSQLGKPFLKKSSLNMGIARIGWTPPPLYFGQSRSTFYAWIATFCKIRQNSVNSYIGGL